MSKFNVGDRVLVTPIPLVRDTVPVHLGVVSTLYHIDDGIPYVQYVVYEVGTNRQHCSFFFEQELTLATPLAEGLYL